MTRYLKNKRFKRIRNFILFLFLLIIALIIAANYQIENKTRRYLYSSIDQVPYNNTGLLLGTSKYIRNGLPNPFFYNRIKTAVLLFKAKKVKYIIVSGDNNKKSYNEPMMMKKELMKQGIPDSVIFLDYAGFRTFDSVIRCYEIFGQNSFTIISQQFHLERAIYISHRFGLGAIGFEAQDVNWRIGLKTGIREYFARVKVFWDLLTGEKPKFLGEKVVIK
jgi:SanA protein